jgi:hypothetical protein
MPHIDLTTSFQQLPATAGAKRAFFMSGCSADCVVFIEAGQTTGSTAPVLVKHLTGTNAKVEMEDASTILRYTVKAGTVGAVWLEADPSASIGPTGPDLTPTTVQTANYTADAGALVLVDPTGGAFAVTLPAASANSGKRIAVKNIGTSTTAVTVTRAGSDTIDGATTSAMTTSRGRLLLISDGVATWHVIG